MKELLSAKMKRIRTNPAFGNALRSMKPVKNVWGFLGVVLFFIVPEIVAFVWGEQITAYARESLLQPSSWSMLYEALAYLFEEGGSWINLLIGVAFLIWLFF